MCSKNLDFYFFYLKKKETHFTSTFLVQNAQWIIFQFGKIWLIVNSKDLLGYLKLNPSLMTAFFWCAKCHKWAHTVQLVFCLFFLCCCFFQLSVHQIYIYNIKTLFHCIVFPCFIFSYKILLCFLLWQGQDSLKLSILSLCPIKSINLTSCVIICFFSSSSSSSSSLMFSCLHYKCPKPLNTKVCLIQGNIYLKMAQQIDTWGGSAIYVDFPTNIPCL